MVLSGIHPFERYARLPGPRGWFPLTLLLLAAVSFPIWTGFVGGVLGTLLEGRFGLDAHLSGIVATALAVLLVLRGGYDMLERIQLVGRGRPARGGGAVPRADASGLAGDRQGAPRSRRPRVPVVARLGPRRAGGTPRRPGGGHLRRGHRRQRLRLPGLRRVPQEQEVGAQLSPGAGEGGRSRRSARPTGTSSGAGPGRPSIDATISFAVVLAFSCVFAVSGAMVLGPRHQIPSGDNLLNLQAQFVTQLHPWLLPLYVLGAFLAIAGTLYATIAVAPAVLGEAIHSIRAGRRPALVSEDLARDRSLERRRGDRGADLERAAPDLRGRGVPAPHAGRDRHPRQPLHRRPRLRLHLPAQPLARHPRSFPDRSTCRGRSGSSNVLAGLVFLALGVRGYWDFGVQKFPDSGGGWLGGLALLLTLLLGMVVAWSLDRRAAKRRDER